MQYIFTNFYQHKGELIKFSFMFLKIFSNDK